MIIIVNYGMGNLGAIHNMLKKIGKDVKISSSPDEIKQASKIILPGVGSFDHGMRSLNRLGLIESLNSKVLIEKTPCLGICLGAQLITKKSEEGELPGLGWIDADTIRFDFSPNDYNLKVPNMGWNTVILEKNNYIFHDMDENARFYFVHSFHIRCHNKKDILTTTNYGYSFVSSVQKENIIGVQFHPEKSHRYGLKLLKNFSELQ